LSGRELEPCPSCGGPLTEDVDVDRDFLVASVSCPCGFAASRLVPDEEVDPDLFLAGPHVRA